MTSQTYVRAEFAMPPRFWEPLMTYAWLLRNVQFLPKPLQKILPIYFGANSPKHIRRVAETADGWIPAGMPPQQLRVLVDRLHEATQAVGRDPKAIAVAPQFVAPVGRSDAAAIKRYREIEMH